MKHPSPFYQLDELAAVEIAAGFLARMIHTANNSINFIDVKAGSSIPLHSHMHHQCSIVLSGSFEMTINETTEVLKENEFCIIPPFAVHGGRAITHCKLLDIFSPARQDYMNLGGLIEKDT